MSFVSSAVRFFNVAGLWGGLVSPQLLDVPGDLPDPVHGDGGEPETDRQCERGGAGVVRLAIIDIGAVECGWLGRSQGDRLLSRSAGCLPNLPLSFVGDVQLVCDRRIPGPCVPVPVVPGVPASARMVILLVGVWLPLLSDGPRPRPAVQEALFLEENIISVAVNP